MQSTWEEAHSVALRECIEKGMSFSEAARTLNDRFGTAYTRNAAIGRARRIGLCAVEKQASARPLNAPRKPDPRRISQMRARSFAKAAPKLSTLERAAALELRCVAITPRNLALVDLEPADCRYPYGGDAEGEPITFCGHPRRDGSSYCPSHFHLTCEVGLMRERAPANKAPLRLVEAA